MQATKKSGGVLSWFANGFRNGSMNFSLTIALVVVSVALAILSPVFLSLNNFTNILVNSAIAAILAAGATVAMLLGGMDISQYSVLALVGMVAARLMYFTDLPLILAGFIIPLLVAIACGVINGVLVGYVHIVPVITTMGMMQVYRGITYIICNAQTCMITNKAFRVMGRYYIFDVIPVSVLIMVGVYLVTGYMLKYTSFGRKVFSVGGNKQASHLSGIDTKRVIAMGMLWSALCAGVAGLVYAARLGAASPTAGEGSEMTVMASVILGGISLTGGKGKLSGTILGCLLIALIQNGLTLLAVQSFYQLIVNGAILIIAVTIDLLRTNVYKKAS